MKTLKPFFVNLVLAVLLMTLPLVSSCSRDAPPSQSIQRTPREDTISFYPADTAEVRFQSEREVFVEDFWRWIFNEAGIPESITRNVVASVLESPAFVMELLAVLEQDPYTYFLVDKNHPLDPSYSPSDLLPLRPATFRVTRDGMLLREPAIRALEEMAQAARQDGITFTVGSAYRSFQNQAVINANLVRQMGQEEADRVSAPPGHSQHQLGLVVDFSPIDDSFAQTPASRWLVDNAGNFGWSLSYPDGLEHITGYVWESWHYRYVGRDLALFIDTYFEGIQQYALQFIQAWKNHAPQ